jgi:PAS domain S-box-containing protein
MITLNVINEDGLPGKFIEVNEVACERLGYTKDELLNMAPIDIVAKEKISEMPENARKLDKEGHATFEIIHLTKDGEKIPVEVNNHLFKMKGKKVALAISRDITERKKAEEQLRHSLEEKEMLMKEIHHRVKNNLMVISSLLNLQSKYIKDKESLNIFKESQSRAKSMALIHERLYRSDDMKKINFGEYIETLSNDLYHTYVIDQSRIKLKLDVEDAKIDINTSVPLGLIVNELVSNCMKHAFPNEMNREINISIKKINNHFLLNVKDNGIGFPEGLDFENTDSLGLQLVNMLVNQIDGEIELKNENGTEFKITFEEMYQNN